MRNNRLEWMIYMSKQKEKRLEEMRRKNKEAYRKPTKRKSIFNDNM